MKTKQKSYEQINQSESQRAVQARDNKLRRWIVLAVATCLLIVGIVSGAVALRRVGSRHHQVQPSQMMTIAKACNVTAFPDVCVTSLSSYSGPGNFSDPRDLVVMAMIVAFEGMSDSWELVEDTYPKQKNETVKVALKDCLDTLQQGLEQVNASIARFRDVYPGDSMAPEAMDDALTWLSSALTYQTTCTTDGFENITGEVKKKISMDGAGVEKLLRNALAMLQAFSNAGNDLTKWKP